MFPVRYELNFCILCRRNSVFKGAMAFTIQTSELVAAIQERYYER
jgi:hypothetical protein